MLKNIQIYLTEKAQNIDCMPCTEGKTNKGPYKRNLVKFETAYDKFVTQIAPIRLEHAL